MAGIFERLRGSLLRTYGLAQFGLLALVSLLLPVGSGIASLAIVAGGGFLIAKKAPSRKLLTAALLPVVPSIVLQALYYMDRGVYYPWPMVLSFALINVCVAMLASVAGGFWPWYRARRDERRASAAERERATYVSRLTRLTAGIVLATFTSQLFVSTFLVIPVIVGTALVAPAAVSPVSAACGDDMSADEFVDCFDPEKEYESTGDQLVPSPVDRNPKNLNGLTPEELQQFCMQSGGLGLAECAPYVAPPVPEPGPGSEAEGPWYGPIVEFYEEVTGQNTGKGSNASAGKQGGNGKKDGKENGANTGKGGKKLSWQDQMWGFGKGMLDTGMSMVNAVKDGAVWVYNNPKKVVNGARKVLSYLTNPVNVVRDAYRGAKWVYTNRSTIIATAKEIKRQGDTYGWGNVAKAALFSKEAVDAWNDGEYGYAIGRGMSEFALNIVTLIPPVAAAKVPLVGKQLATVVKYVNVVDDIVSGAKLASKTVEVGAAAFRTVPKLLGTAQTAGSTLGKAIRNGDVLKAVTNLVDTGVKRELAVDAARTARGATAGTGAAGTAAATARTASGTSAAAATAGDILPAVSDIGARAAKYAATDTATARAAETVADLYGSGKSFDNAMTTVAKSADTASGAGAKAAEQAADSLGVLAKKPGLQHAVSDAADPVVAKVLTREVINGTTAKARTMDAGVPGARNADNAHNSAHSGTWSSGTSSDPDTPSIRNTEPDAAPVTVSTSPRVQGIDEAGATMAKNDLTPIAVKTNADSSTEILTMNGAGKAEVHVVAADGVVVSKPYVAKAGDTAADAGYVSARPVIAAGGGSVRYGDEVELVARKGETTYGADGKGSSSLTNGQNSSKKSIEGKLIVKIEPRETKDGIQNTIRIPLAENVVTSHPNWSTQEQWLHSLGGEMKVKKGGTNMRFYGGHREANLPAGAKVINKSKPDVNGVYTADIEVTYDGVTYIKEDNTMVPEHWTEEQTKIEVDMAYKFSKPRVGTERTRDGVSPSGITFTFHIDQTMSDNNWYPNREK